MKNLKIGFIGFGLIGGSIARALKNVNKDFYLIAYQYNEGDLKPDFKQAVEDNVLDHVVFSLEEEFDQCDIIFLCAPVLSNIRYLSLLKPIIKKDCILTDVGSVKGNIHHAISELDLEKQFVGGHPMTGSEKTGYSNSYALLLENAYYILTPEKSAPSWMVETLENLVNKMGSIAIILDPDEHDEITAAISHLPHILASQLVNLVKDSDDKEEHMRELAAGGFRDITRIASSSPTIWQEISLTNSKSIKKLLDKYISYLDEASKALETLDEEYIYDLFDRANEYRSKIPNKSIGPIKKIHEVYVDILDEAGAIADIATLLANNKINIKNIGIIHNREFFEGVFRIEFYDHESSNNASKVLQQEHYNIYER